MTTPTKLVLLAAFVLVDVVLVVGVWRHVGQDPPTSDVRVPAAAASSAAERQADADNLQEDYTFKPATAVALSIANDGTILRGLRGRCDGDEPAKLTVSTDGGKSTDNSATTGLSEILAVSAVSSSEMHVVGATGGCVVSRLTSTDGGSSWRADPSNSVWYPDPDDKSSVVSPEGSNDVGCTVTSLSQVGTSFGRVTCGNGTIRGTGNGGKKWVTLGRLDNVRVASFSTFNTGYALAVFQGCAAQEMTTRDGGRSWSKGGCITGEPAQAIDANDTGLVGLVANQVYASENGGKTWEQVN